MAFSNSLFPILIGQCGFTQNRRDNRAERVVSNQLSGISNTPILTGFAKPTLTFYMASQYNFSYLLFSICILYLVKDCSKTCMNRGGHLRLCDFAFQESSLSLWHNRQLVCSFCPDSPRIAACHRGWWLWNRITCTTRRPLWVRHSHVAQRYSLAKQFRQVNLALNTNGAENNVTWIRCSLKQYCCTAVGTRSNVYSAWVENLYCL